jgi:hypothetical protein
MKTNFNQIYQFKISLNGSKTPIWRRIQVPETYSFWDLHVAIQDAMGWDDYHLHEFEMINPVTDVEVVIGIPNKDDSFFREVLPGWEQKIAEYFTTENPSALYTYDFGDDWVHNIKLEKILPREKNIDYPVCIKGKRACPPEDCGGIWGYEELLEIIHEPKHEEYEEMLEWVGEEFDPEHFDVKEICFNDPNKCLRERI